MKEKTYLKRFGHEIALPIYKPDSEPNSHLTTLALFDWTSLAIITLLILTSALLLSNSTTYPTCAFPSPLHIGSHLSPSTWTALVSIQFSLFGTVLLPCLLTLFTSKLLARNLTTGNGMKISTLLNTQESAPLRTQYRHGNLGLLVFKVLTKAGSFILCITCIFSFQALPARGNTGITLLGSYLQIFILVAAICSLWVLFWRPLPLLGEWPAQWLCLLNDFDKEELKNGLEGTGVGKGKVGGYIGETRVWLSERYGGGGEMRLETVRGSVKGGWESV